MGFEVLKQIQCNQPLISGFRVRLVVFSVTAISGQNGNFGTLLLRLPGEDQHPREAEVERKNIANQKLPTQERRDDV